MHILTQASACLEGIHLEFDQAAYSVAVSKDDAEIEDFFLSRNVLTEGSRIRCRDESGLLVSPSDATSSYVRQCDGVQRHDRHAWLSGILLAPRR